MTDDEKLAYLTNLVLVARSDDQVMDSERRMFDTLAEEIRAAPPIRARALSVFGHPTPDLKPLSRLSDQVRCLEDMVTMAICDGELSQGERDSLVRCAADIGFNRELTERLVKETVLRFRGE